MTALRASFVVVCVFLLAPAVGTAQTIDGEADWGYGRSTWDASGDHSANGSFTQGYTLAYRSMVWGSRFLTYTGELTFNKNALTFGDDSGRSQQTGFKASAALFPTRPFRAALHATRSLGGESVNYPGSGTVRGGLALTPGSAPELRTTTSGFGTNVQYASKLVPRIELSYDAGSAAVAAGSLRASERRSSLQALVAREGARLSNTLRYQRNGFDNGVSQAFRQRYSDLGYELVARATNRTWGTLRAGHRTTYSLFDVPRQLTDIGIDTYHPPPSGQADVYYGLATLAHQATTGISADMSIGVDREKSEAGGTMALLTSGTTRYRPFGGATVHATGTYGERGQDFGSTRLRVLTRSGSTGAEYQVGPRIFRASAAYEAGRGWNKSSQGVDGMSRMWRGRADIASQVLGLVQVSIGHDRGGSADDLLPLGNLWQERTHASARSTLTSRVMMDATYEVASIDRGVAPQLFRNHYTQATATTAVQLTRERRVSLNAARFLNRASGADDGNEYVGIGFDGTLIGPLRIAVTARREHTSSTASRLDQDGYYTTGVIDYRLRLFTLSLEYRYTDLTLSTAGRIDPLTFNGNQILFRAGRKFGLTR